MAELTGIMHSTLVFKRDRLTISTPSDNKQNHAEANEPALKSGEKLKQGSEQADTPWLKDHLSTKNDLLYQKPKIDSNVVLRQHISDLFSTYTSASRVGMIDQQQDSISDNPGRFSLQLETAYGAIIRITSDIDPDNSAGFKVEIFGKIVDEEVAGLEHLTRALAEVMTEYQNEGMASLSAFLEEDFAAIKSFTLDVIKNSGSLGLDYEKNENGFSLKTSLDDYDFELLSDNTGAMIAGYENDLSQFRQEVMASLLDYKQDTATFEGADNKKSFLLSSLDLADRINKAMKAEQERAQKEEQEQARVGNNASQESTVPEGAESYVDIDMKISTPAERFNGNNLSEISQAKISIKRETQVNTISEQIKQIRHLDDISLDIRQHKDIAGAPVIHANFGKAGEQGGQTYQYRHQKTDIVRETLALYKADELLSRKQREEEQEELLIKRVVDGYKVDEHLDRL